MSTKAQWLKHFEVIIGDLCYDPAAVYTEKRARKPKLTVPICTSKECSPLSLNGVIITNASPRDIFCPDCNSALFWQSVTRRFKRKRFL